ncbi:MAG: hypothetical protein K6G11_09755 [Lachnospiraceae bacterium]|nr:hypothetical protein [Lachnospiraceae bacterium]
MNSLISKIKSNKPLYCIICTVITVTAIVGLGLILTACTTKIENSTSSKTSTELANSNKSNEASSKSDSTESPTEEASSDSETNDDSDTNLIIDEKLSNSNDGEHVIEADGETIEYKNVSVTKTGDSDGDEADFYGENSAIFATNKATLTLSEILVNTNGAHANAIFSYGEGTTVNVSDSTIKTKGNCSGGLMTTGGGTMNATNLTIETSGNSSAAIRSDRGGGDVNVDKGYYETSGTGSPVIYSTAEITVKNSTLLSNASQGVVVEGQNSATLINSTLTANNTEKNSDKSSYYQAVMIYQSMSGDANVGTSSFTAKNSEIINNNGDIFFVNNTATNILLKNTTIKNNDSDGIFLRAAAAGWGNEGSNGGKVNLTCKKQKINGDIVVDKVSALNFYLKKASSYKGAINSDGEAGEVYVELDKNSTWTLTADSYITSLTCDANQINLNGHTLYINGKKYKAGKKYTGKKIKIVTESSGKGPEGHGDMSGGPGGNGEKPEGMPEGKPGSDSDSEGNSSGHEPPSKPGSSDSSSSSDSDSSHSGRPDKKPDKKPDSSSDSNSSDSSAA